MGNDARRQIWRLISKESAVHPNLWWSWMLDEEFYREIHSMFDSGVYLCDSVLLPVMKRIYSQREEDSQNGTLNRGDFQFTNARKAIRKIENAIATKEAV